METMLSRVKRSERITVATWGWMNFNGLGELFKIDNRLTVDEYVTLLEFLVQSSSKWRGVRQTYPLHILVESSSLLK